MMVGKSQKQFQIQKVLNSQTPEFPVDWNDCFFERVFSFQFWNLGFKKSRVELCNFCIFVWCSTPDVPSPTKNQQILDSKNLTHEFPLTISEIGQSV